MLAILVLPNLCGWIVALVLTAAVGAAPIAGGDLKSCDEINTPGWNMIVPACAPILDNNRFLVLAQKTPATITVEVEHNTLIANSGATSTITATVVDSSNAPVPGVVLSGTVPITMGIVSELGLTDASGQVTGTWTAGNIIGSSLLSVWDGSITGTTPITLTTDEIDSIFLSPAIHTVTAGERVTYTVTASDVYSNRWDMTSNAYFIIDSAAGGRWDGNVYTSELAGAKWRVSAFIFVPGSTKVAHAGLTVIHGPAMSFSLAPSAAYLAAGQSITYTVVATDAWGNEWDATATASYTITPGAKGSWATNVYTSEVLGTWAVTATHSSKVATATLTVDHGVMWSIALAPVTHTVAAGECVTYTVTASDAYGNSWDLTASSTYTLTPGARGSWATNVYTSEVLGTWAVTATHSSKIATAALLVNHGTVDHIALSPLTQMVAAGECVTYSVTADDAYNNTWDATHAANYAVTAGARGSWIANVYTSQIAGSWTVTATVDDAEATATLTVTTKVRLPLVLKSFPPIPIGQYVYIDCGLGYTYQPTVTLLLFATVQGDTIKTMLISNNGINWDERPFTSITTWTLDLTTNGLKTVYVRFKGNLGGISAPISDSVLLFNNGDFSQDLLPWSRHGGLGVTVVNSAARLGDQNYPCNNVPVDYAGVSQTFIMPNVPMGERLFLNFTYQIHTQDLNTTLDSGYDRFVVLINGSEVFKDMNKDSSKRPTCDNWYSVGPQGAGIAIPTTYDPDQEVTVEFRVYNRPDNLYNTYIDLDNVHLEFTP